jgi:hypothetical protein
MSSSAKRQCDRALAANCAVDVQRARARRHGAPLQHDFRRRDLLHVPEPNHVLHLGAAGVECEGGSAQNLDRDYLREFFIAVP